jgi:hypothetical protein
MIAQLAEIIDENETKRVVRHKVKRLGTLGRHWRRNHQQASHGGEQAMHGDSPLQRSRLEGIPLSGIRKSGKKRDTLPKEAGDVLSTFKVKDRRRFQRTTEFGKRSKNVVVAVLADC